MPPWISFPHVTSGICAHELPACFLLKFSFGFSDFSLFPHLRYFFLDCLNSPFFLPLLLWSLHHTQWAVWGQRFPCPFMLIPVFSFLIPQTHLFPCFVLRRLFRLFKSAFHPSVNFMSVTVFPTLRVTFSFCYCCFSECVSRLEFLLCSNVIVYFLYIFFYVSIFEIIVLTPKPIKFTIRSFHLTFFFEWPIVPNFFVFILYDFCWKLTFVYNNEFLKLMFSSLSAHIFFCPGKPFADILGLTL